ncbi:MAG: hypothetical protein K2J67_06460 [Lachnospiraceae bacterium]|nr:hypothetical protein [Lachnospiraceae bacterium]
MREKEMQELMQQELAVPKKVHDGFEKGLRQIYHMDAEQERAEGLEAGEGEIEQKAGHRKGKLSWCKAGLVAAAAAVVLVIVFHSQIYSIAKSLFIHDTVTVGGKKAQETDRKIVEINDGVLTDDFEPQFFESMEDLGEKLGISFLKSSMENRVTGKGRIRAVMQEWGEVNISDFLYCVKDVSQIKYSEDGQTHFQMDREDAYSIECKTSFFTKTFQDIYGSDYEDAEVIENYNTRRGFSATVLRFTLEESGYHLVAIINHNNILYEYSTSDESCTLEEFKAFLDTLES